MNKLTSKALSAQGAASAGPGEFWRLESARVGDVGPVSDKTVAALIPAKDEELCIAETIESLAVDQGVEHVYVVSDGSSDRTAEVALEAGAKVLKLESNVGKALAIKKGLEHFSLCEKYPYIGIFDSDVICEPGYLPSCAGRFREGIACVIGRIDTHWVPKNGWVAYRTFAIWNYQWSMRRPQSVLKAINITPGSNSVFRADVLARIDWEECVRYRTEDYRYTVQIYRENMGEIVYYPDSPAAILQDPTSFKDYYKQFDRWMHGLWGVNITQRVGLRLSRFDVWSLVHTLNWMYISLAPLVWTLMYVAWRRWELAAQVLPWFIAYQVVIYVSLVGVCALQKRRPSLLLWIPFFIFVARLESFIFIAALFKAIRRPRVVGRWTSPDRISLQRGGEEHCTDCPTPAA